MAFTEVYYQPERWTEFHFFASGGADGAISESVNPGVRWKLKEIRVRLSVAFASVEDLTVRISATQGSAYNHFLKSEAMNGIKQKWYTYDSDGLTFQSDDQMVIALSLVSGQNIIGIEVLGWAVLG